MKALLVFRPSQTPRICLRANVLHDMASLRWHKQNCETLHNRVLVDPEVSKFLDDFDVVQLDMWSNDQLTEIEGNKRSISDWACILNISYAPTIVLSDRKGEEVIRSEDWFKKFHISGMFEYVSSEASLEQQNFQRYHSDRADHLIKQGFDVNFWE